MHAVYICLAVYTQYIQYVVYSIYHMLYLLFVRTCTVVE